MYLILIYLLYLTMTQPVPVPKINISKAIANWEAEEKNAGKKLADEEEVDLVFKVIDNLDTGINTLINCRKLSLSSNLITKIPDLNLPRLEILSLGRNKIKKITGLTFVADTLKQLWISYNEITSLDGVKDCVKLECLYIGNNLLASYNDLNILSNLTNLQHAVFKGNPFAVEGGNISKPIDKQYTELIPEVKKRIPSLMTLDGELCKISDSTDDQQA